ncbi:hypothetical protein F3J34_11330 [Klebsiella sp. Ap-873]|nr:hypothetical protein [Klebsiella sp. Ap-873]
MAQGIQCWDAAGRLIVDLGDYNMKFMGTASITVNAGTNGWTIPFAGMQPTGWLCALRTQDYTTDFYAIPGTNQFTVRYLPVGGAGQQTIYFDVYKWG